MGDKFGLSLWGMLKNVSWTEYLKIRINRLNRLHNEQLQNLYSSLLMNWMHHLQHKWWKCIIYNLNYAFNGNLHVNIKCCRFPPVIHNFLSFALSDVWLRQPWKLVRSWSYSVQSVTITLTTTHVWHTYTARALNTRTVINPDWVPALLKS